jgi:hypothetical protein
MSMVGETWVPAPPEWIMAEMPPGYQNRLAELQRISDELRAMDRFGRLLWQVGDPLHEAEQEAMAALGAEIQPIAEPAVRSVAIRLENRRRLLVHTAASPAAIQRKDAELAHVFRLVHEVGEDGDRTVLVTNNDPAMRPPDRTPPVAGDALALLHRLGAVILTGPTLFALWSAGTQDKSRGRTLLERLQQQDGGVFELPPAPRPV